MNDPLDIYNNTGSAVVLSGPGYTVPASGYVAVAAVDAVHLAKDPEFGILIINSTLGVSAYGQDLGYGLNSAADLWMQRVATGAVQY